MWSICGVNGVRGQVGEEIDNTKKEKEK